MEICKIVKQYLYKLIVDNQLITYLLIVKKLIIYRYFVVSILYSSLVIDRLNATTVNTTLTIIKTPIVISPNHATLSKE